MGSPKCVLQNGDARIMHLKKFNSLDSGKCVTEIRTDILITKDVFQNYLKNQNKNKIPWEQI